MKENGYDKRKIHLETYLNECVGQIEKIGSNIIENDKSREAFVSVNSMYKYLKDLADNFYNQDTTDASLLDYEDKELLGYQKRPLKNSAFIFKTK